MIMTGLRAILILPRLDNVEAIERVRKRYDPSFGKIAPHNTLVFPFKSGMTTEEVHAHAEAALKGCDPFSLQMRGVTGHESSHLFLNVIRGNDEIIDLHHRLYSGPLAMYRNRAYTFFPHLTVGRFFDEGTFEEALATLESFDEPFETTVDEVTIIAIDGSGCANFQSVVHLNGE
ncbi:2'-5' RNA ligase family protein [bacterium]|nr:2'-5' RNA ligase family protein [bacterium]